MARDQHVATAAWLALLGVGLGLAWAAGTTLLGIVALFDEAMPRFRILVANAYLTPPLIYVLARGWRPDGHGLRHVARGFLAAGLLFAVLTTIVIVGEF
ncbi:MAG: hypothetical protein ACYS0E_03995 [Planctomycetota bacterium]